MSGKKEYIMKFKDSMAYLKNENIEEKQFTFRVEEAKKFNKKEAEKFIEKEKALEIANYKEELYNSKKDKYKFYIDIVSKENDNIKRDDLLSFLQEYEFAADESGKFTAYVQLKEQYPNSKFIDEIIRVGEVIRNTNTVIWHKAMVSLSKDKEFTDGVHTKVIISTENIEEYNKAKEFLKNMQKKFPYDYNIEQQYDMLIKKYIGNTWNYIMMKN